MSRITDTFSRLRESVEGMVDGKPLDAVENLIKAVDPERWERRQMARLRGEEAKRARNSYDGATRGRRGDGWVQVGGGSINAENQGALRVLRNRSRDLAQNTWVGRRAVNVRLYNVIGGGIKPSLRGDSEAERRIKSWAKFPWKCDAEERKNLAGIQALAYATMVESGEALILRRRKGQDPDGLPFELQVREGDWLDETYTTGSNEHGNLVIQGVEFDSRGKRVAYHFFKQHPGDLNLRYSAEYDRDRILAEDVIHLFREWRPGQVRGIPRMAPVLLKIRDWEDYEDAQLIRQKIASCFTAFVTTANGNPVVDEDEEDGDRQARVEPGMILDLKPGEEVEFGKPPEVQGFRENAVVHQREIAAGLDVSYEALTGDYSEVNYSSARMGRIEFDNSVTHDRKIIIIPQMLLRFEGWMREAFAIEGAAEELDSMGWTAPSRPMIDPQKETSAAKMNVRNGFSSRREELRKRGKDPEEVDAEIRRDNEIIDESDFVFDCDPRQMNENGTPATHDNSESNDEGNQNAA